MILKLIKFYADPIYQNLGRPVPAKNIIPNWYKKAETFFTEKNGERSAGLKTCMPYLDSLTSGYLLTTPVDIYVNEKQNGLGHLFNNEYGLTIRWDGPESLNNFIAERPKDSGSTMPRPPGHHPNHLIFSTYWSMKTPRGWSVLMTPPLNRYDLPFTTSSGIIDSDKFVSAGNIPFFMKKDFAGVIPKGTPIVQLIPIKRASWASDMNDLGLADSHFKDGITVREKDTTYKKKYWQRKNYS
jgi:hypothetical protein